MGRNLVPRWLDVTVDGLDGDGLGKATLGNRAVKVKNALPGESVRARIHKRRRGALWAAGELCGLPAADRVEPACGAFPRCGGCAMQHLDYTAQLALKQQVVLSALEQAGIGPARVVSPTTGARLHYRSKARLGVRLVGGEVLVGFRESFSNRVARIDVCPALVPSLSALIVPLKRLIGDLSCPDRIPQVEVAAGDTARALVMRHLDPLTVKDQTLIAAFGEEQRVRCFTQSGGYDTVIPAADGQSRLLSYSNPDFGLHYRFRATDFTQVNMAVNRKLVRSAVGALGATTGSRVLDLFCGIGNFSLALAARGAEVLGLEGEGEAVDRARLNAALNGLAGRCEFAVRDLYDAGCPSPGRSHYILLDPPRSGAGPNLSAWLEATGAGRVAYVSCAPASFAADAVVLDRAGYALEQVGIFDMFPHTAHVETLGVFQRRW